MTLPHAVAAIWNELETARGELLAEARDLSQRQVDWQPAPGEWSIGEVLSHLAVAETQTGKLTTRLTREAAAAGTLAPFPAGLAAFEPPPPPRMQRMQAPEAVRPERGLALERLLADLEAVRARTRGSMERIGGLDPRPLTFKHPTLGDLDLAQWWMLQARHDAAHLAQIRGVKAAPGFPPA